VKHDVVVFPGALTPSEVMIAWKAGSDFVKVFPCSLLGGASYVKAIKAPFPDIPLIASGGVTEQTAAGFHPGGSYWSGNWQGFGRSGGCASAATGLDSRAGGALLADR
jgi:2-keto-3-deoxy-6-phosphogluconate aldolase